MAQSDRPRRPGPRVLAPGVLDGRICLVTGAGGGLGRAIAVRLAELGAAVQGLGRTEASLAETAAEIAQAGGRFAWTVCDVRDRPAAAALVERIGAQAGLDLLVNNAGGQFASAASRISARGWDAVLDLNLTAVFSLIQAAYPHLARRRGAVVNISLTPVELGAPGLAHAVAARAGVLGLTRSLAREWAPDGVRMNCLAPGVVDTDAALRNYGPERLARLCEGVPLGRPTAAEEAAELVAFLASPAAAMVTGQLLQLDGGASLAGGMSLLDAAAES